MSGPNASGVVVDTSAAFAVITDEPSAEPLWGVLAGTWGNVISAATIAELGVVLSRRFTDSPADLPFRFIDRAQLTVIDVDAAHARRAIEAHQKFGAGRHPARLNYGDCFTYATAAIAGLPILCLGDDFARTGIGVVTPPA